MRWASTPPGRSCDTRAVSSVASFGFGVADLATATAGRWGKRVCLFQKSGQAAGLPFLRQPHHHHHQRKGKEKIERANNSWHQLCRFWNRSLFIQRPRCCDGWLLSALQRGLPSSYSWCSRMRCTPPSDKGLWVCGCELADLARFCSAARDAGGRS